MRPQQPRPKPAASRVEKRSASAASSKSPSKGASQSKTLVSDRFGAYLAHHRFSALDSLQRLLRAPGQSLLTWMVIAIALALPATLYTSLQNLQALGQRWDGVSQLSVFVNPRAKEAAIDKFQRQLQADNRVEAVTYISPQQALAEFEQQSGLGSALQTLDSNPLPPALIVKPQLGVSAAEIGLLVESLKAKALVDDVVVDLAWVQRMQQLLALAERLVLALGLLLVLGVLLVVGNTIRLAIENRRDEIVVVKLVGGTNAFVRRPFLYTGIWYGIGGGLLAWLLLMLAIGWLSGPVGQLATLYQSDFYLQGLGFSGSLAMLLLAALVGWIGAWLAVARHLGQINPQ
ncbi:permease-like cell division protein FtsX [Maricurvus nonylphenolicus]|uniref:permease-like cell division protein FtsX n=1 Tax=Maricurvus nonylphenolicus TaxID=1008307 RepID=UPI0036F3D78E